MPSRSHLSADTYELQGLDSFWKLSKVRDRMAEQSGTEGGADRDGRGAGTSSAQAGRA